MVWRRFNQSISLNLAYNVDCDEKINASSKAFPIVLAVLLDYLSYSCKTVFIEAVLA